ncbi:helix-turn-helix transcriptional regulator [Streptomyces sp. NPDC048659]|uniref:helix-turn-helix domain-containing protein n=1 Tax=Streptomyces sp. NPDC048659 TaxID=3155489 RepID=UPI003422673F
MVNRKALDPDSGPQAAYGARLRSVREGRGWTQEELDERTAYSSKHISAVETGRRSPTPRFSRSMDTAFGLTGRPDSFERESGRMSQTVLLEGFPEYLHQERRAVEIRLYEVGVIPGLMQTPEYAAALAASAVKRGSVTPEQAEERVALIEERQATLVRTPSPLVHVVLDESCIRRPIGGRSVMDAQFARLAEFAELPNTIVQVAPFALGARRPFDLPITVLTLPDRSLLSYAESSQRGHLERESTSVVATLTAYHQLQAESPSQAASVAMVNKVRKGMS